MMTSLGKKFIVPGLDQPGKQLTFDVDGYFSAASSLNLQQVTTILDKHKHGLNVDVNAVYHETKTRRTKGRVPNKKCHKKWKKSERGGRGQREESKSPQFKMWPF